VSLIKFRDIKREIRIIGISDTPLSPFSPEQVELFGVVYRGGYWFDGIINVKINKNGLDATDKISEMITTSPHYQQLRVIMLDGIACAGYNLVNIRQLFDFTSLPVISITIEKPNFNSMKKSFHNIPQWTRRWKAIEDAREVIIYKKDHSQLYLQIAGLVREDAEKILRISSKRSIIPEPLRVAKIISVALTKQVIEEKKGK
jgi:endonuclease V-like protein UPF0215 family